MTQPAPQAPGPPPGDHDARPELAALVDTLRASGQPATLTAEGRHGWVPNARGELLRVPLECTDLPARGDLREVLAQPGTYLCSYMRFPAAEAPRNCFDYVCRDRDYSVEQLSKNGRRDVRRGLRCFEVRTCTVEEMSAQGFGAYADTEVRHDHTPPPREEFDRFLDAARGIDFYEFWGAWREGGLAAWIRVLKADDWAFITHASSRRDALRDCPNNAVVYEATRRFLGEEDRSVVSYGISSIQATDNIYSLHRFKLRMGFQAEPRCRQFVVRPWLRPLFRWRVSSWLWDRAVALRPGSAAVHKAAGLARLLSGRATDPLAWASESE